LVVELFVFAEFGTNKDGMAGIVLFYIGKAEVRLAESGFREQDGHLLRLVIDGCE